jgi:hypothetical protein
MQFRPRAFFLSNYKKEFIMTVNLVWFSVIGLIPILGLIITSFLEHRDRKGGKE